MCDCRDLFYLETIARTSQNNESNHLGQWTTARNGGRFGDRLAALRGDRESAIRLFSDSIDRFERHQMPLYQAATGFRLAELLEGIDGREEKQSALGWLESKQVRNPDAMIRMVLP
jgi:hypothetical protein